MKKVLLIFLLLGGFAIHVNAQEKGDARIHALGTFGLKYNEFGVAGGVEYFFVDLSLLQLYK